MLLRIQISKFHSKLLNEFYKTKDQNGLNLKKRRMTKKNNCFIPEYKLWEHSLQQIKSLVKTS